MIRKLGLLLAATALCFLGGELFLRSLSSTKLGFHYSKKEGFFYKAIEFKIDQQANSLEFHDIEPTGRRYARPLTGFAIAATVAIAAIFGLQQLGTTLETGIDTAAPAVAEGPAEDSYTVPDMEYFQRHDQYSSESGYNNFETRRVSAELQEDGFLQTDLKEIDPPKDPDAEDAESLDAEDRQAP